MGIFWTNLWKKPKGFFKQWLKGMLVDFLWSNSQFAHWVYWDQSGGLFLSKLSLYLLGLLRAKWEIKFQKSSIYPVGKLRVYCLKTLNKLPIYPLGNTPSAPSDLCLSCLAGWRDKLWGPSCMQLKGQEPGWLVDGIHDCEVNPWKGLDPAFLVPCDMKMKTLVHSVEFGLGVG